MDGMGHTEPDGLGDAEGTIRDRLRLGMARSGTKTSKNDV